MLFALLFFFFFFNDTATTEIYTLSLHDALPIYGPGKGFRRVWRCGAGFAPAVAAFMEIRFRRLRAACVPGEIGRATRLNSSHANISYAVFCLKKKNKSNNIHCI